MTGKQRGKLVVFSWFVWILFCLALVVFGLMIVVDWWKWDYYHDLGRVMSGLVFILLGSSVGYFVTDHLIERIVSSLPKGDFRQKNNRGKGPKIVVVGGGTGLGTILRGLKEISSNLTAIVTVADDGGSSGRLRKEFGILPPGDIRNCLVAMADLEPLMERLMQYRFKCDSDLSGHSFGNLFLTALTDITGDFEAAIKQSGKVLAVRGQVLPATLEHVVLQGELCDGTMVTGESHISESRLPIQRILMNPEHVKPVPEAITAINEADVIILGPGSLFTSIIPNLLVEDIAAAIRSTKAVRLYVCNAMTQSGETDHFTASEHIVKITEHAGPGLIDMAIVNTARISPEVLERYAEEGAYPVEADLERIRALGIEPLGEEIVVKTKVIRHDAQKLALLVDNLVRKRRLESIFGKFITKHFFGIVVKKIRERS